MNHHIGIFQELNTFSNSKLALDFIEKKIILQPPPIFFDNLYEVFSVLYLHLYNKKNMWGRDEISSFLTKTFSRVFVKSLTHIINK